MEKEQLQKIDSKLLRRLLKYAKPYILSFIVAIAIIVVIVVLELYQPMLVGQAVDGFLSQYASGTVLASEQDTHIAGIVRIAFIYFLTVIGVFILNYSQAFLLARTGQKIINNITGLSS